MRSHPRLAWLVLLAIALAAAVVAWRTAEGWGDDIRIVFAAAPLLAWCLSLLLWTDGHRRNPYAVHRTAESAPIVPTAGDADELKAVLRRHRLHGRSGRYRVPLFLVIGPGGMGKSTFLERSTLPLDLPVPNGEAKWWVGPDAIFVEATTGAADMEALAASLDRFRPARPVNGIVLAVSPADLALCDAMERREIGEAIASAVAVIGKRTRSRPPVTLILTKTDLAPGFTESVGGLTPTERDQMWGFALPLESAGESAATTDPLQPVRIGIRTLVEGTRARLVDALSRIDDPLHGGRLVHFGAQIAALDTTIDAILRPLMPNPGRGRQGGLLRGIYLTSAQQDALTIDALLPELATRFAMPRSGTLPPDLDDSDSADGFFIASTMRKAILGEAGLVGRVRPPWYRRPVFGAAIALAAITTALLTAAVLQASTLRRNAEIDAIARVVGRFEPDVLVANQPDRETLAAVAVQADRLERIDLGDLSSGPWWPFLGRDTVEEAAQAAYQNALRNSLRPHLVAQLEADLVDIDATPEVMAARLAAADPAAPDHGAALAAWIETLASEAGESAAANALRVQAPRALATLAPGEGPQPVYLDTARRIIGYQESLP